MGNLKRPEMSIYFVLCTDKGALVKLCVLKKNGERGVYMATDGKANRKSSLLFAILLEQGTDICLPGSFPCYHNLSLHTLYKERY